MAKNPFDKNLFFEKKIRNLIIFFFVILFVLWGQVFILSIIRGDYYLDKAINNQQQYILIPAERGMVYDRYFKLQSQTNSVLIGNKHSTDLFLLPGKLKYEEIKKTLEQTSILLHLSFSNLQSKFSNAMSSHYYSRTKPVLLLKNMNKTQLFKIAENKNLLKGLLWQESSERFYPLDKMAAHVLGYVGVISKNELNRYVSDSEYHQGSMIGKTGIEKYYDRILRGKEGQRLRIVDAWNRVKKEEIVSQPRKGKSLVLTIDTRLQKMVEQVLHKEVGAIVVSDPSTGEILAMASSPTFNPNWFVGKINPSHYNKLVQNPNFPFLNRAISAKYPPSSTFKIITLTAGLQEEIVNKHTQFLCRGFFKFENDDRIFKCWGIHGWVNAVKSLQDSCDVYYYNVGYRLGSETISKYAKQYGLGSVTGIDLPGESSGFIPSHAWKRKIFKEAWYDGDTVNMSIGQGFLLATPIQMLNVISAIANKGIINKPYLLKEIIDSETGEIVQATQPKTIHNISISKKNLEIINKGLRNVWHFGTAYVVGRSSKLNLYGKTGTAQLYKGIPHSWFMGYIPKTSKHRPLAIVAFIEHGGGGGEHAAPIAASVLQAYLYNQDAKELKKYFFGKIKEHQENIYMRRQQINEEKNNDPLKDIHF